MCSGARNRERVRAENEAKRQARLSAKRQAEMDQLAAQRQAVAEAQQAELGVLEKQMADQQAAQREGVAVLQAQQAQRLGGIRASGAAAAESLRILSQSGVKQAPTAPTSGRPAVAGRAKQTTASLRMGATSRGTGSGANVSV